MTKAELLADKIFQMAPDDMEIALDALGYHKVRRVRFGKTERTGDKQVLIIGTK